MAKFPHIDRPCPLNWNALPDAGGADCAPCGKRVHNLSAMTERERVDFLAQRDGETCVAYALPRRAPPAVASWLLAAAVGAFGGTALAAPAPAPDAAAIAGAVDGDKGDTLLEPMLMVGAVIDPKQAAVAGADAAPELPVVVDDTDDESN